jgi:putative ATP-grasp target RiPP
MTSETIAPHACTAVLVAQGDVRPFGLTRTTPVTAAPDPLAGFHYDPARQISIVTRTGTPVVDSPEVAVMATSQNTQHDHQWFTDKD